MRTTFTLLLLLAALTSRMQAQEAEVGLYLGLMNYQGDLTPQPFDPAATAPAFGLTFRQFLSSMVALKGHVYHGKLMADERIFITRAGRGAMMENDITEVAALFEWHPLGKARYLNQGIFRPHFSPYGFIGGGLVFNDPEVEMYGREASTLKYTQTEANTLFTMPVGVGLRLNITSRLTSTLEIGSRTVFSDVLDGLSTNGETSSNDWYFTGGLTVLYSFNAIKGAYRF